MSIRGDRFDHDLLSYAITLGLIASFPRGPSWILAALVLGVGLALELLQATGLFAGDAQAGDLVADAAGALLALGPVMVGNIRGREGNRQS